MYEIYIQYLFGAANAFTRGNISHSQYNPPKKHSLINKIVYRKPPCLRFQSRIPQSVCVVISSRPWLLPTAVSKYPCRNHSMILVLVLMKKFYMRSCRVGSMTLYQSTSFHIIEIATLPMIASGVEWVRWPL